MQQEKSNGSTSWIEDCLSKQETLIVSLYLIPKPYSLLLSPYATGEAKNYPTSQRHSKEAKEQALWARWTRRSSKHTRDPGNFTATNSYYATPKPEQDNYSSDATKKKVGLLASTWAQPAMNAEVCWKKCTQQINWLTDCILS